MKVKIIIPILLFLFSHISLHAQTVPALPRTPGKPINWTQAQLIQPAALVALMKNPQAKKPVIFNIGVMENIPGARKTGAASEKPNLDALKKALVKVPKSTMVVVYCGCCPFEKCPNVRPAFQLVKDLGFINARLLNLPTNLKTDWLSKGYPLAAEK